MRNKIILGLLILIHLFLLSHLRFTLWPEILSYPYFSNQGFVLYRDFIYPYPPLLTLILSQIYKTFGYSLEVVQVFTWSLLLTNDVLIFLITKKFTQKTLLSLSAVGLYVFLQPFLEGNMLWFDGAMVTPLLAAFLLTLYSSSTAFIFAGLFFVIAIFIKQTAAIFPLLFVFHSMFYKKQRKLTPFLVIAPLLIGLPFLLWLWGNGIFSDFLNWTIIYPASFWSSFPGYVQFTLSKLDKTIMGLLLLPLLTVLFTKYSSIRKKPALGYLFLFIIGSLIAVYPRFSYFHLQPAFAFISIASAVAVTLIKNKKIAVVVFIAVVLSLIIKVHRPVIALDWDREARFFGSADKTLALKISETTPANESIFLLGIPSQIYVLSERVSPKPWVDNFGWYLEIPGVQEQILLRWSQNPPLNIFWSRPKSGNWYDLASYQPKLISEWIRVNYDKIDEVEPNIEVWRKRE